MMLKTERFQMAAFTVAAFAHALAVSPMLAVARALEEQLGLKLQPAKAPMDVLVIDSIDQPEAN